MEPQFHALFEIPTGKFLDPSVSRHEKNRMGLFRVCVGRVWVMRLCCGQILWRGKFARWVGAFANSTSHISLFHIFHMIIDRNRRTNEKFSYFSYPYWEKPTGIKIFHVRGERHHKCELKQGDYQSSKTLLSWSVKISRGKWSSECVRIDLFGNPKQLSH